MNAVIPPLVPKRRAVVVAQAHPYSLGQQAPVEAAPAQEILPETPAAPVAAQEAPLGWMWDPRINVKSVGGFLLLAAAGIDALTTGDWKPVPAATRTLGAAAGAKLLVEELWRRNGSPENTAANTFVLPGLGVLGALGAAVVGGYFLFRRS